METRQETTFMGNPMTLLGHKVKVGEKAPKFVALNEDLTPFTLEEVAGKVKLISVVPSVDTGVCELQTIRFNKEAGELKDVAIITISVDLPFAVGRFCGSFRLQQTLFRFRIWISDRRTSVVKQRYRRNRQG